MPSWLVLAVAAAYVAILFLVAWWGDRRTAHGPLHAPGSRMAAIGYCLTLAIYNTSWSFYGSVGRAAASGLDFLPIYIGPTLVLVFGQPLLARVIAIAKARNATSIADFIGTRYGRSQTLAALVTLTALVGVLPYIALQLKAVGTSFDVLTAPSLPMPRAEVPFWRDTAFAVAVSMALFAIIFGVRHIHASEHHRGLMLAIAFESVVKLVAFLAVGAFIVFGMFDGIGDLLARARSEAGLAPLLAVDLTHPTWLSNTLIAAIAFLCLPQAFHVAVVENEQASHARTAAFLYPLYLALISVFMVPIAIAGLTSFGASVNPDTFMITLPLAAQALDMGLLAFIGGLSAATGMVIVAAVALSTMLCNDVVMPILLRTRRFGRQAESWNVTALLIAVRRLSVLAILLLAYLMHRLVDQAYPLTVIGLLSFVAVAQFGPAFLGALYWPRANGAAAITGISAGFLLWAYTLLLPSLAPFLPAIDALVQNGPFGQAWLKPQALFGLAGLDPISHAVLWSLGTNLACFILLSLLRRPSLAERIQAAAFAGGAADATVPARTGRAVAGLSDLRALAARFVGPEHGATAFDGYVAARRAGSGPALDPSDLVDADAVRFTENLLAGAIGAASARVVMAASLEGHWLSRGAAMAMLDEASEALRFNHKLLRGTLESVPQGICAFDADLRISAWNGRFLDLLDLPGDLVRVGLPLADLVAFNRVRGEYGVEDLKALVVNRDIAAQTWPYVYERRRPDGMVLEITYDRMPEGGYISTYADVTERHRAAQALRQANETLEQRVRERTEALELATAEAERANAGKTRFLASASHDLLQPLNAARLFLAALDDSLGSRPAGAGAREDRVLAESATASLQSAEDLLNTLLDISSLDAGAVRPQPAIFVVADMLSQLCREFSALARERGLKLRVVPSVLAVRSDPQLLRRVLQNFLANAVRYTPKGRILLGCRRRGDRLRIEVWDTGVGIPEHRQAEIFEEFRQLNPPGITDKGQGLGLAIVERISRLLGHDVTVRSRPGHGTCFSVSVPLAAAPASSIAQRNQPVATAAAPLLVLCIDNDATILQGLGALLDRWGHQTVAAGGEDMALARLADRIPDVVLVDYHLDQPHTGLEVLDRLRRAWARQVRALLVTADRSEAVHTEAQARGCDLLLKPVKPAALRRFLNGAALHRRAALDGEAA